MRSLETPLHTHQRMRVKKSFCHENSFDLLDLREGSRGLPRDPDYARSHALGVPEHMALCGEALTGLEQGNLVQAQTCRLLVSGSWISHRQLPVCYP